ncbi:serine/threonine-protein phosphatase 6 regulatory ankyrin repeat subunit B isoform X1 [Drosophila kikkawai]|uniref:Serine/threonine-protein phosphatase 6 regulatory ankyrin repeat subunit B isoform X1 n=2 Tax=Drosophila kikkawai TaxID=30033 RepID=A0A6P4JV69_DROKI|nr:ankyrin repeat, PH and SEC7 domain containing protein secG isoform X1 [Drosophila kikkawai]
MLSYDLNERLLTAVKGGDFEQALGCIMQGAQASYVSPSCGRTAVGTAAILGDAELLELLVQSCEEPELDVFHQSHTDSLEIEQTPEGMEKLEWVDEFENCSENGVSGGSEDSQLYQYYAKTFENTGEFLSQCCVSCREQDPHLYDADLATPLHYAASWGHEECVRILLEHNAPINVVNSEGYAPLHTGAGFAGVTKLLIKHGALVNAKTLSDGRTALHLAIESKSRESARLLLQTNININDTDDIGETPLMTAIACSMVDLAEELVEKGARINLQDKHNNTALLYAVRGRHGQLAKLLLEHGARRLASQHLLHIAVENSDRMLVELLLQYGESLSVRNEDNHTPIMVAIHRQCPKMLEYLLDTAEEHRRLGLYTDAQDVGLVLFAVQQIVLVEKFKGILRVLLAKLASAREDLYGTCTPTIVCGLIYCQTPLSRTINLFHLELAEFLIHEGCNLAQICREHVVNELRANCSARTLAFARLLCNAGFQFPHKQRALPKDWSPARLAFERQMTLFGTQPRSLQSLSRLVIRKHLLKSLRTRLDVQEKYLATQERSSLGRIIDEFAIPATLKLYLSDFTELPKVTTVEPHPIPGVRSFESWD